MSDNVWQELAGKSETLADKLGQNTDLANTVMALLCSLIVMANDKGVPFEGVSLGPLIEKEGEFSSRVTFSPLNVGRVAEIPTRSDFFEYARSRSQNMALALSRSPRLHKFFEELVEAVVKYALSKGIPFQILKVYRRFITHDNILVFQVGREYAE